MSRAYPDHHPIRLGELRAARVGIYVTCSICLNNRDLDPAALPDHDDVTLDELVDYARCTRCDRRRGGIGMSPDWRPWVRHLRATGQHHRIPRFAQQIGDD